MCLIVPEIDTANLASTCERLESEFRKEITNWFEEDLTERLSIKLCVYPEPPQLGDDELERWIRFSIRNSMHSKIESLCLRC